MECPNDETLLAFKAGRLNAEEESQVEEHLAACSLCRTILVGWIRAEIARTASAVVEPPIEEGRGET